MEDLNNCKQFCNESISDLHQKLEVLNSPTLCATKQDNTDVRELLGKIKTINEITLNRCVYHSNQMISQMLRWKDFDNLNSDYCSAVVEHFALCSNEATNILEDQFAQLL